MATWAEIGDYMVANWSLLSIPVVSAVIGWGTNVLALKMTFFPVEFKGVDIKGLDAVGWKLPMIGWQGIIPSKAATMAAKSVDLITTKLIDIEEQFAKLNPKVVAKEMSPHLRPLMRQIIDETLSESVPLWKMYSDARKESVYQRAENEIPNVIEEVMQEVKVNIMELLNLKKMAIDQLTKDKSLLNEIFLRVGKKEFKFIEYSGAYFGFIFGLIQMAIFMVYDAPWQLPVGGLLVGYLTNDLALRMIFSPLRPINFGFFTLQGLFIKRQTEVAREYAQIIAENIMTMPKITEAIFGGKGADKLADIIVRNVNASVDSTAGFSSALIKFTSGTKTYDTIKARIGERFVETAPQHIHLIFDYAKQALDIEHTLREKMSALPPDEFVGFLRPVFQEDELKLILIGAFLGLIAGFLQIFTV
jgi:uncharacterized membrane protein YheB (UPF0754 family)